MASKVFWKQFWAKHEGGGAKKPPRRKWGGLFKKLILLIALGALGYGAWWAANKYVPPQHLPWRPLNLDAPVGMATGYQLSRLSNQSDAECLMAVREAEAIVSEIEPAFKSGSVCGWNAALTMRQAGDTLFAPADVTGQCGLSAGLYIWLRGVREAAVKNLGSSVVRVYHYSTYSCRRQNGNDSGQWSEHAFANAWDISGFELEDGQKIFIKQDWNGADSDKRQFLRDARNAACDVFHVTLSPDYNAAHADHFHVDMGPSRSCR